MFLFSTALEKMARRQFFMGFFVYSLFIFSVLTTSGVDLAIILLLLLAGYHRLREPISEPLPWWVVTPFFAWWFALTVSALVNPAPLTNLLGLGNQLRTVLPLALIPAFFQVNLRRLLLVYLLAVVLFAGYGIIQFFWGVKWLPFPPNNVGLFQNPSFPGWGITYRPRGFFGNVNGWAYVIRAAAPLFFALWFFDRKKNYWFWGVGAVLCSLGTVVSLSRGAWLGLTASFIVLFFALPRRFSIPLATVTLIGVTAFSWMVFSGEFLPQNAGTPSNPIINRLQQTTEENASSRIFLWESAIVGIKKNLWFGVGVGDTTKLQPYRDQVSREKTGPQKDHFLELNKNLSASAPSHNFFLQSLFSVGIVGFVPNLALIGVIFAWNIIWIRKGGNFPLEKAVLWGVTASLSGTLFHGIVEDFFFFGFMLQTIMMYYGLALFAGLRIRRGLAETGEI